MLLSYANAKNDCSRSVLASIFSQSGGWGGARGLVRGVTTHIISLCSII